MRRIAEASMMHKGVQLVGVNQIRLWPLKHLSSANNRDENKKHAKKGSKQKTSETKRATDQVNGGAEERDV